MKYRQIFWAIILIAMGLIILFGNLGWIEFHWSTIWQLWPLILIVWGISILPVKDLWKFTFLGVTILFAILFFNRITEPRYWFQWHGNGIHFDNDLSSGDNSDTARTWQMEAQSLTVPFDSLTRKAVLNLEAAAGNFKIEGLTTEMISFQKEGDIGNYSLLTSDENGKKMITLQLEKSDHPRNFTKNKVEMRLSDKTAWDLDFDIGAASLEMDLKDYRIDTAEINSGASSIEITLGSKNPMTYLNFNAGASSIDIRIPKESACEIRSESFLVSRDFPGFSKKGDGRYQSDNFSTGKNKIYIRLESAVSSISVDRY